MPTLYAKKIQEPIQMAIILAGAALFVAVIALAIGLAGMQNGKA